MNLFYKLFGICPILVLFSCSDRIQFTVTKNGRPVAATAATLAITDENGMHRIESMTSAAGTITFCYIRSGDSLFSLSIADEVDQYAVVASGGIKGRSVVGKWDAESYNTEIVVK